MAKAFLLSMVDQLIIFPDETAGGLNLYNLSICRPLGSNVCTSTK
jgi:hypothetical protein